MTRTTEIISTPIELDGTGVSAVAEQLDMSVSLVHSHLATLHEADYLLKENRENQLSYEFLTMREYVRNSSDLFRFGGEEADSLAEETGHYVHLFTEEKGLRGQYL